LYITTDHDDHIHILESMIRTCLIYMDGMVPRKDDKMWCWMIISIGCNGIATKLRVSRDGSCSSVCTCDELVEGDCV
jgi:hypothetical protein